MTSEFSPPVSDDELLAQITQGRLEAFEPLWDRYYPQLMGYAQKRMPHEAAEDAVSDTMEGVLKAMSNGHGPRKHARGYFFQSLRNTMAAWRKHPERRSQELDDLEPEAPTTSSHESSALVDHVLQGMPAADAVLLRSVLLEGLDVSQMALLTGETPERVSTQLYRAKRRFRTRWVQAHVDLTDEPQACRTALALCGAVEAGTASAKQQREFDHHLATCPDCPGRLREVRRSAAALSVMLPAAFGVYALNGGLGAVGGVMPAVATGVDALASGALTHLSAFWSPPKLLGAAAATTVVSTVTVVGLLASGAPGPTPALVPPSPSSLSPQTPGATSAPSASEAATPDSSLPTRPEPTSGSPVAPAPSGAPTTPLAPPTGASSAPTPPVTSSTAPSSEPVTPGTTTAPSSSDAPAPSTSAIPTDRETCSWSPDIECLPLGAAG
jgi:RNA polymerase sigma factor (sigma-70 family)